MKGGKTETLGILHHHDCGIRIIYTVLYAEPTLQGNAAICKRQEGEQETQMNLELLFNAVINKKLND